jgi:hypothetical protein
MIVKNSWSLVGAALLVLLPAVASGAAAQVPGQPGEPGELAQEAQERLIEMFLDRATIDLNLSAEQRGELEGVLRETMERRGELGRRQLQLHREIRESLADPATPDDRFRALTEAILSAKRDEVELLAWQRERLLEALTPRQTLRYLLLQQQLAERIERMRRKRAAEGRGPQPQ